MLSFFRKKSTGCIDAPTVDDIVPKMEQLSAAAAAATSVRDVSACEEALDSSALAQQLGYGSLDELKDTIYGECVPWRCIAAHATLTGTLSADILRTIKDPEKPQTLEDLNVVYEEGIFVKDPTSDNVNVVSVAIACQLYVHAKSGVRSHHSTHYRLLSTDISR